MAEKRLKQARYFHVVGGGCFGTQYLRWLLRARSLGMLTFEKIFMIDRDPNCRLALEGPEDSAVERRVADWVDYITELLLTHRDETNATEDHWVPSPLSPHLLFLGFSRAAARLHPGLRFEPGIFSGEVPTPVRIPLATGNLAVSFAEWKCPVNCIEPPTCPAIHAERTWDMKPALENYFSAHPEDTSAQVLQCRHFVHGVGTIPLEEILGAFRNFLSDVEAGKARQLTLATVSGCHGLIGAAKIVSEVSQP